MPPAGTAVMSERRRLLGLARQAAELAGPKLDRKLATLVDELKSLLTDGYDPIVFCRFIDTAEYVADVILRALRTGEDSIDIPHGAEQPALTAVP